MLADNGLDVNIEAVNQVLNQGDVITIGFTTFPQRLLVDVRANEHQGSFAGVVAPVATVQERYHWLGRYRGTFGAPEAFTFFVWPLSVRTLVERDVLAPLRGRLDAQGKEALDAALQELLALERDAFRAAIRGDEPWRPLWERARAA